MKNIILPFGMLILTLISFHSCNKDLQVASKTYPIAEGLSNSENLRKTIGVYADLFSNIENVNGGIYFEYADKSPNINSVLVGCAINDELSEQEEDDYKISFGNLEYVRKKKSKLGNEYFTFSPYSIERASLSSRWHETYNLFEPLLQTTQPIVFSYKGEVVGETDITLPPLLNLTIDNTTANENYQGYQSIPKENVQLKWTKDKNNDNGVFLMFDYSGFTTNTEMGKPDEKIIRVMKVDDTGQFTLPRELLEGVPNGAMTSLILYRGPIKFVDLSNGIKLSIHGLSRANVNLILE